MTKVSNPARLLAVNVSIAGSSGSNASFLSIAKPRVPISASQQNALKPVQEDDEDVETERTISLQGSDVQNPGTVRSVREATKQLIHKLDYSTFRFPNGESTLTALSFTERTRGAFSITRLAFIGLVVLLLVLLTVGTILEIEADRVRNARISSKILFPEVKTNIISFPALKQLIIRTKHFVSATSQTKAVEDLVSRLFSPNEAARFSFDVVPGAYTDPSKEGANVTSSDEKVMIIGSSGVACGWALHHFLRYYCGCHVSWSGRQLKLPTVFPTVSYLLDKLDWLQYYQNTCTSSYSFVWWNWTSWEREIDWMVLQGINFPLAFTGQEEIWRRVYLTHGLTDEDLGSFFGGPAFLAWSRMGNINGWGGPLPREWMSEQLDLQKKILNRMHSFGMTPILPAFNGIIPDALLRVYPSIKTTQMKPWGNFSTQYRRSLFLDPEEVLFTELGSQFISEMRQEYRLNTNFYNVDTFNENRPSETNTTDYIRKMAVATFNAMTKVDPDAVWVMQAWLFVYDSDFWTPERTEALLTAVPIGRMILLDLDADNWPVYNTTRFFYGQPFIWCMLHNFGGVSGLYGRISIINQGPILARTLINSTMIGVGITPEGINQNDMVYELMNEMSWRRIPVDLNQWVKSYTDRRFGVANINAESAYSFLRKSVYDCPYPYHNNGKYALTLRPAFYLIERMWYDENDVFTAWKLLLRAARRIPKSDTLNYDIVDISRQNLQIIFYFVYEEFSRAFFQNQLLEARRFALALEMVLADLEDILQTDDHFSLDAWVSAARSWGRNYNQTGLYEYNALNQVTLWGPDGNILDYAAKQWCGLIGKYYRRRWQLFLTRALDSLMPNRQPFNQSAFDKEVFQSVEQPFTFNGYISPSCAPKGQSDALLVAEELQQKYRDYQNLGFLKFLPRSF